MNDIHTQINKDSKQDIKKKQTNTSNTNKTSNTSKAANKTNKTNKTNKQANKQNKHNIINEASHEQASIHNKRSKQYTQKQNKINQARNN